MEMQTLKFLQKRASARPFNIVVKQNIVCACTCTV